MSGLILAVDNGSQSTKLAVVDAAGRILAEHRVPLRPYAYPAPGHVVHPEDDLWDSVVSSCRGLGSALREVTAVGLCSIRFCRSYLRADGSLAAPVLSWMDRRVDGPPDVGAEVAKITTASGYLSHRFTGEFTDTAANYQGWWPIDQDSWRWSTDPAAYERTGIPKDRLVDLVDPGQLLGRVTPAAAAATGLPVGIGVYATANDKAVEALGSGLVAPGPLLLSLGTYIAAMTVGTTRFTGSDPRAWSNFHAMPGRYLHESDGIRRGMWTVSWLSDVLGRDVTELNDGAGGVPAGCDGLLTVLDWLAPGSHPHRRGSMLGFGASHGRYHLHRSVLEGICLTMADHAEAMRDLIGGDQSPLVVSGGGSRSDLMMQIAADAFARPAVRPAQPDAATLGAAICAAVGSGLHPDWESAVSAMVRWEPEVRPGPDAPTYRGLRIRHAAARDALDRLYRDLPGE